MRFVLHGGDFAREHDSELALSVAPVDVQPRTGTDFGTICFQSARHLRIHLLHVNTNCANAKPGYARNGKVNQGSCLIMAILYKNSISIKIIRFSRSFSGGTK